MPFEALPPSHGTAPSAPITHVFFDAEGTLWQPRPGRSFAEFWRDPRPRRADLIFQATPGIEAVLRSLRGQGLRLVVASVHDVHVLPALLETFGLRRYFDDVLVNGHKGARILQWLDAHDLRPENAVMVGDRVDLDVAPVESFGVRALLLDRPYNREAHAIRIHDVRDLAGVISFANRQVVPSDPAYLSASGAGTWTGLAPTQSQEG